ncbi:ATP-binding protein [Phormidium sp. FACHB-322]|uniref:ATP-binding protein n=2 Tax=Cyanobacteriota TaxID=1117 RepID=UPI0019CCD511|nr:ATP-binding protein [Phormidium sp. FACHB-322]
MMTREEAQAIYLGAKGSLQQEALDACWERYDLLPKMVGGTLAIGGALVLSAWLPGVGPWLAWTMAGAIAAGGTYVAGKEGASIERGDNEAISRYIDDERMEKLLKPFIEQIQAGMAKKPLGAVETQAQTTETTMPESGKSAQTEPGSESAEPTTTAPDRPVDRLLWRDGEHLVLIGLSGSSKTTTLIDCVPSTAPVIYITLKSEDKAPEGWRAYRLRKFADQAFLSQLDDLCSMLTGLVQAKSPHRLIIDEALTILDQAQDAKQTLTEKEDKAAYGAVAARFEGLLKMYIRTGRSDGHWLGLVTQSPNGTDLFGSAKTMQGLKLVLCAGEASSNKFDFVVAWAKQLYGQFVTDADEQRLRETQSGFWHFWLENGQIQYRATPKSDRALADIPMLTGYESLLKTPTPDNPDAVDWDAIARQLLEQPSTMGLRQAAAAVTGKAIAGGGPAWVSWRDEFIAEAKTLDPDLQDALLQRFPAVLG